MTLSSQEKPLFQKRIPLWHLFYSVRLRASDNTTSQNIGGTDAWAVPNLKFWGTRSPSPHLNLRLWLIIWADSFSENFFCFLSYWPQTMVFSVFLMTSLALHTEKLIYSRKIKMLEMIILSIGDYSYRLQPIVPIIGTHYAYGRCIGIALTWTCSFWQPFGQPSWLDAALVIEWAPCSWLLCGASEVRGYNYACITQSAQFYMKIPYNSIIFSLDVWSFQGTFALGLLTYAHRRIGSGFRV